MTDSRPSKPVYREKFTSPYSSVSAIPGPVKHEPEDREGDMFGNCSGYHMCIMMLNRVIRKP
jgi:hypothetical protein